MIGWVDASAGVSGDMLLGALVDAEVPVTVIQEAVDSVIPGMIRVTAQRVDRAGFAAARCEVRSVGSDHRHRTWPEIERLLASADLAPGVREPALRTFELLARAEADVHGTSAQEIHFHEVGAWDSIADIVGVCAGVAHLQLRSLSASPVAVGAGTTDGAHGTLPVPPPAVARLLRGIPSLAGPDRSESCTPTGAALLATLATSFGPQPQMVTERIGVGAGERNPTTHPNVTRLFIAEPSVHVPGDVQVLFESNVDDMDPRLWPSVLALLLEEGASDAWLTPILMKKGRPAHTLHILAPASAAHAVRQVVFAATTSIGIREMVVDRSTCERSIQTVSVDGHAVRIKVAVWQGRVVNTQPEYEDVAELASRRAISTKEALILAVAAAAELRSRR